MKCYVFRDLLPEYVEELCSAETAADMAEHLETCDVCKKYAEAMNSEKLAEADGKTGQRGDGQSQNGQPADVLEKEIQPFKKIKHSYQKKTRELKVGIALLAVFCIVLGVLTVGQIWPETQFPSFDRLLIRHRAKQVGLHFAEGNMDQLLNDMLDMAEFYHSPNLYNRLDGKALYGNVAENLNILHEKYVSGEVTKVYVDNIYYTKQDSNHSIYLGKQNEGAGIPLYWCDVIIEMGGKDIKLDLFYLTNRYYMLADVVPDAKSGDNTGSSDEREQIAKWLDYFGNAIGTASPDAYVTELVMEADKKYPESTYRSIVGRRFSKDCMVSGEVDENGDTAYGKALGKNLKELAEQVETIDFTIKNKGYDEEKNKGKATLFWSFTDDKGQYVNMTKALYYGPYGYQAVDEKEIICCEGELDAGLKQKLEALFD